MKRIPRSSSGSGISQGHVLCKSGETVKAKQTTEFNLGFLTNFKANMVYKLSTKTHFGALS